MAGATGLILSFLAGVMVGRGVDSVAGEVQAARTVQEDRIVAEETPKPVKPATEDLTYAQRLEGDMVEDTLERPAAGAAAKPPKPFSKIPPPQTARTPRRHRPACATKRSSTRSSSRGERNRPRAFALSCSSNDMSAASIPVVRLPAWARKGSPLSPEARPLRVLLRDQQLTTVCEEARCPNLGECFARGTATFMLLGDRCTRRCG